MSIHNKNTQLLFLIIIIIILLYFYNYYTFRCKKNFLKFNILWAGMVTKVHP